MSQIGPRGSIHHARRVTGPSRKRLSRLTSVVALATSTLVVTSTGATALDVRGSLAVPLGAPATPTVTSVTPDEGTSLGGTRVTIFGEHLLGVTTVDFGSTAVALKAPNKSKTQINVVSPAGTGTVNVTVSTPEASSEALPGDQFAYQVIPPVVTQVIPASAPVAAQRAVTIRGEDFTGATEVRFGAVSVPFTVGKPTLIKTRAPIATLVGVVNITVTTPEGTSAITPADQYTFEAERPGLESFSPSEGPAAGGNTVILHGVGFLGTTNVRFGGEPVESFEVISDLELAVVPAPHTTESVQVTVTTPKGTSGTCDPMTERCEPPPLKYAFVHPTVTSVYPTSGPLLGGTMITVDGTGFSTKPGVTEVRIGALFASSVECSSISTCTAVVPAAKKAGTRPLEVRVPTNLTGKRDHSEPSEAQFIYE